MILNINNFNTLYDMPYYQCCAYFNKKTNYGKVPYDFLNENMKVLRQKLGLFTQQRNVYHNYKVGEPTYYINGKYGKHQQPENLVYCNYIEKAFLFVKIIHDPESEMCENSVIRSKLMFELFPIIYAYLELGIKILHDNTISDMFYKNIDDSLEVFKMVVTKFYGQYTIRQMDDGIKRVNNSNILIPNNFFTLWRKTEDQIIYDNKDKPVTVIHQLLHNINERTVDTPRRSIQDIQNRMKYLGI